MLLFQVRILENFPLWVKGKDTVNLFYPPDGQAREFSVMRK